MLDAAAAVETDELQERIDNPTRPTTCCASGWHRLPITQFPRIRSLAGELATYDGATEVDQGLTIVLAGLRSQLPSRA